MEKLNLVEVMTQEDKELLLQDLCARLPYGVKGIITYNGDKDIFTVKGVFNILFLSDTECCHFEDFKPYLRPMSSMTEEQIHEFNQILGKDCDGSGGYTNIIDSCRKTFSYQELDALLQLLNKYHFDYRGLIEKGLAIDCTNLNIY